MCCNDGTCRRCDPEPPRPVELACKQGFNCNCLAMSEWRAWARRHGILPAEKTHWVIQRHDGAVLGVVPAGDMQGVVRTLQSQVSTGIVNGREDFEKLKVTPTYYMQS